MDSGVLGRRSGFVSPLGCGKSGIFGGIAPLQIQRNSPDDVLMRSLSAASCSIMAICFSGASAMANRGIGIPRHLRLPSGVQAAQKLFYTGTGGPHLASKDVPLLVGYLIGPLGLHARPGDRDYSLVAWRWCLNALRWSIFSLSILARRALDRSGKREAVARIAEPEE